MLQRTEPETTMEFTEHLFGPLKTEDAWRATHSEHLAPDEEFTVEAYDGRYWVWLVCLCGSKHLHRAPSDARRTA